MSHFAGPRMSYRPTEPHRCNVCASTEHVLLKCPYLDQSLALHRKERAEEARHKARMVALKEERSEMLRNPPKPKRRAKGAKRAPREGSEAMIKREGQEAFAAMQAIASGAVRGAEASIEAARLDEQAKCAVHLANIIERNRAEAREDGRAEVARNVVYTIGGVVDGLPTQTINYLQRLRELVRIEEATREAKDMECDP